MRDTSNPVYIDLTLTPAKINGWINAMGKY